MASKSVGRPASGASAEAQTRKGRVPPCPGQPSYGYERSGRSGLIRMGGSHPTLELPATTIWLPSEPAACEVGR